MFHISVNHTCVSSWPMGQSINNPGPTATSCEPQWPDRSVFRWSHKRVSHSARWCASGSLVLAATSAATTRRRSTRPSRPLTGSCWVLKVAHLKQIRVSHDEDVRFSKSEVSGITFLSVFSSPCLLILFFLLYLK